jgi:hypothetical protein
MARETGFDGVFLFITAVGSGFLTYLMTVAKVTHEPAILFCAIWAVCLRIFR